MSLTLFEVIFCHLGVIPFYWLILIFPPSNPSTKFIHSIGCKFNPSEENHDAKSIRSDANSILLKRTMTPSTSIKREINYLGKEFQIESKVKI